MLRWRPLTGLVLGWVTVAALTGCGTGAVPGEPYPPVAVRMAGATVEILYTDCPPVGVRRVKIVRPDPHDTVIKDSDPVVWQESFTPPSTGNRFRAGATEGGQQDIPLAQPLESQTEYAAFVQLNNDTEPHVSFQLNKLAGARVSHRGRYMSAEEFAKYWPCRSSGP
jgi:hypothetical protein